MELQQNKKVKLITKSQQFVLASSSQTRIRIAMEIFQNIKTVKHKIDEESEKQKNKKKSARKQAEILARKKVESIKNDFPNQIIIASDQILECGGKVISKPKNMKEAARNIAYLTGKNHKLFSAICVFDQQKLFFEESKMAEIHFKKISQKEINEYLYKNKETALNSVGSYKIEDNYKYNFMQVISGDLETITGFPLNNFLTQLGNKKI